MNVIKHLDIFTRVSVFVISIISSYYIAYNFNYYGYEKLFLLPLTYGLVFILLLSPVFFKNWNLFLMTFFAITFLRFVVLPVLIVYSGWYGGRSDYPPLANSFDLALSLMIFELIVSSVFIFILFRKKKNSVNNKMEKEIKLPENYFFYILFIVFSFFLLFISPQALNTFSFIRPAETMEGFGEGSFINTITTYALITSKYLVFLILLSYIYKLYKKKSNVIYIWLALVVVLLNILIIFGDNRSDFIITAVVSIYVFYRMFPKGSKIPILILFITILIVTSFITSHRGTVTQTDGVNPIVDITDTLQVYLGGPYNVAIATEVAELNPESRNVGNLVYDFLRPAIGINMLVRNWEGFEFSNYLFNQRIYFSDHTAQIIPMIGQGYFYFGFIFSPLLLLLFIGFVKFLISYSIKENRIELIFFLSIPITRTGFAMGQNAGILINDMTFFLLLNLLVYYLNNKIVLKK